MLAGGVLEIVPEGWGFLRFIGDDASSRVVYVSAQQIARHGLKNGDLVTGQVRPPKETEKHHSLFTCETVNGASV